MPPKLAVVYLGMAGAFSRPPLEALLRAGISVRAVVMPAPARLVGRPLPPDAPPVVPRAPAGMAAARRVPLPLLGAPLEQTIVRVAAERKIPILEVSRLADPRTVAALAAYAPDALCVACFPWRIPLALLRLTRLGCLNVHPSLLPDNRGPDPLFWTFWRGDETTGVTIHRMDERLDAGPLIAQRMLPVAEGIGEVALERQCAEVGGELLAQAVQALATDTTPLVPQDEAAATTYPWPVAADYVLNPERSARWAHRFVCGLVGRGQPLRIRAGDSTFRVAASLGYDPTGRLDTPWRQEGDEMWLRCAPGIFHARLVADVRC
ncbi:MAG: hypothetical protein IVW57_01760 [Ktedonobacterales bacterium]|nr:hypothetical protein [Ktedonobacterales bacterium]